jgi:hypothetical protein
LEGRWARLTLSAHYDHPGYWADISREDYDSLLREVLMQGEIERRQVMEMQLLKAVAIGGLSGKDAKADALFSILKRGQSVQYPWLDTEQTPEKKTEDYTEYYNRIMAKFHAQYG